MPLLKKNGLTVNFKIIGQASTILKYRLTKFNNVEVHENVKNPERFCANSICGLCNLNIAAGVQNKVLEYMRIGLPTVISEKCFNSFDFKNNKEVVLYKNQEELVKKIIQLKKNKIISNKISYNGRKKIKKYYSWSSALKQYDSIV